MNNTSLILILIFPSHKKFKDSCLREYFSGLETELMQYLKVIYSQLFNLIRYTKYYRIGIKWYKILWNIVFFMNNNSKYVSTMRQEKSLKQAIYIKLNELTKKIKIKIIY